jgi:tetratricopeptide (TPR) repeat protein
VPNDKKQPSSPAAAKATPATSAKPATAPVKPETTVTPPTKPPRLFRPIDWVALVATFFFVFIAYYLTIAPEMTLEDSGELATGSFYAGIPHPPGYPVWTIFTYFWTLIPIGNVAWRVALAGCFAGALSSGLLAMMVSRGSSMMIESIDDLRNFDRRWENAICLVSGFVSGLLIGFNGYMWSQAVIVEVYPLSVVSLMAVLICLMRWVYAPFQHRYLYAAFFFYGICVNNHQSLLVIAMGMEVLILFAEPKLGREMMFWNTLIYLLGLIAHPDILASNTPVFVIFNLVGVISAIAWFVLIVLTLQSSRAAVTMIGLLAVSGLYLLSLAIQPPSIFKSDPDHRTQFAIVQMIFHLVGACSIGFWIWLFVQTKKKAMDFVLDLAILIGGAAPLAWVGAVTHYVPKLSSKGGLVYLLPVVSLAAAIVFATFIKKKFASYREWLITLGCGGSWLVGAAFYLYMPIAGATVPPMEWGYPRTLEGFIHALTRGQYEKIHPTSGTGNTAMEIIHNFFNTYLTQIWRYMEGLNDELNILYLLLALVVFLFYLKMKRRERVWIIGMVAIFFCLGPFLVLLLNFPSDRQSLELNRVFLTSSHVIISMFIGFGLTLLATYLATHYASARRIFMVIGLCIVDMAMFMLIIQAQDRFDLDKAEWANGLGYFKILCWLLAAASAIIFWREGLKEDKLLSYGVPTFFGALSIIPTIMALSSLEKPIKFNGIALTMAGISDAFKPAHYGLPVLAALLLLALGLIFVASLWMYRNRAPLIITLGVFAIMPSYSIFNHWFNNEQRNHWFGYWFGHDMFTPPVEGSDGKFTYDAKVRAQMMADKNKKDLVYPEMARDAILFGGTDPGRFAPTYMIFCDSFIPHNCLPEFDQNFDRRDVYIITQNALADPTYLQYIRSQYFRSAETQYDTPFFQELLRGKEEKEKYSPFYGTNALARTAYNLLDKPITEMGLRVETRRRKEGVFPPKEIYTPSPEDSNKAFSDYMEDAQQRIMHDQMHPNEPKQMKPGEDVKIDASGHLQVAGQVAVMAINGLLTKVIFDKNPKNEFYVEESFPLDWMFPNLTPYGVIMKINRDPVPVLTDDILKRDHEFWAKYSERLIGNWITYDTPVTNITAFVEKVYMHHDYSDFKGDLKFIRDDQGQKAFSKLRSSIAGVYSWRLGQPPSGGIMPMQYVATGTNRAALEREADFAYKQAFAFCPFSPEAVYRYVQLLVNLHRAKDALAVAETAQRLDPYNNSFEYLLKNIREIEARDVEPAQLATEVAQLEKEMKPGSTNFMQQFELAEKLMRLGQNDRAFQVLDGVLSNPQASVPMIMSVAKAYNDLGLPAKLQGALEALTRLAPDSPEAWYDLSASHAMLDQNTAAIDCLKKALQYNSQRLAKDPKAQDIRQTLAGDARFAKLREMPEFKNLPTK